VSFAGRKFTSTNRVHGSGKLARSQLRIVSGVCQDMVEIFTDAATRPEGPRGFLMDLRG